MFVTNFWYWSLVVNRYYGAVMTASGVDSWWDGLPVGRTVIFLVQITNCTMNSKDNVSQQWFCINLAISKKYRKYKQASFHSGDVQLDQICYIIYKISSHFINKLLFVCLFFHWIHLNQENFSFLFQDWCSNLIWTFIIASANV